MPGHMEVASGRLESKQGNAAPLGLSQLAHVLMNGRGFSTADRAAVTTGHLLLILYHQVVSEEFLSR